MNVENVENVENVVNSLWRLALKGGKKLMTARVSMLLKSRAYLTCFRACFLPGRAKDLSASGIMLLLFNHHLRILEHPKIYNNLHDTARKLHFQLKNLGGKYCIGERCLLTAKKSAIHIDTPRW